VLFRSIVARMPKVKTFTTSLCSINSDCVERFAGRSAYDAADPFTLERERSRPRIDVRSFDDELKPLRIHACDS